ncbi:MAG TPA: MtnX-like HAD-IB family phosphatase [Pyrinomonadaceae bacterium]|nr:MtnX-like HAD-IB family phosphatase [Pyrinomonadaceae bacterium]
MTKRQTPILFLDFDGTISKRDVIDAILEQYADERWLLIEEEWRAGRIGSRACLNEQIALVRATQDELDALLDSIELDEGSSVLLQTSAAHHVPTHIISDGFDYCIRRSLARRVTDFSRRGRRMRICASQLEVKGDREWRVDFPFFHQACAHGCATCKPAVMSLLNSANAPTIFVGDGLSDRYAAASADLVFAKKSLAAYCREQRIAHVAYDDLEDVAAYLETALQRGTDFSARELMERVGA